MVGHESVAGREGVGRPCPTRLCGGTALEQSLALVKVPTLSIVVLTFNRAELLRSLLQSLSALREDVADVIVVDNHSKDGTPAVVQAFAPWCMYVRTAANLGVGARNLGLRRATGDIVVCLDDDVSGLDSRALQRIRAVFAGQPQLGAVNFKILDAHTHEICNWVHHCKPEDFGGTVFDTYEITEGAVAFRKAAVEAAGFYPDYFFLSHEGPDLAFRMMNAGYRVQYRGDIVVRHAHAIAGRKSWMCHYYDTRNQYWLAARNLPMAYGLRYLLRGQVSTLAYSVRDGHLRHWVRAVRDGLLGLRRAWADRRPIAQHTVWAIREIDAARPSFGYLARKRLFQKEMRL
jgi:GT2 family glycosyltransferase